MDMKKNMKKTLLALLLSISYASHANNQNLNSNENREDILYATSNTYAICVGVSQNKENKHSLIQLILNNIDEEMKLNKKSVDDDLAAFGVNKDIMKGMILRYYLDTRTSSAALKERREIAKEHGWNIIGKYEQINKYLWNSKGCSAIIENIKK